LRLAREHGDGIPKEDIQRRAKALREDPAFLKSIIEGFSNTFPQAIDRRYRIYCVSTKSDSELMWAHYAQQHKGICLEFTSRSDLFYQALKVHYRAQYPRFAMADDHEDAPLMVLLTKSSAWMYEDEYRLIAQERRFAVPEAQSLLTDNDRLTLPDRSLEAIILGCLAPEETVRATRELVQLASHPIRLKRAVKAKNQYRLLIEDLA
jgi:hypothetical protein